MKQLQKSDLKNGEIYICIIPRINIKYLIEKTENLMCNNIEISTSKNKLFYGGNFNGSNNQFFEATPEEKHWLETCIKENKFVSYEEAMKTFIPEFTLPEKWYIKARLLNDDQLQKLVDYLILINKNNGVYSVNIIKKWYPFISSVKGSHYIADPQFINDEYHEITFNQFKQYVLKENTTITEEPKVVLEEPKDKVLTLSSNYGKESIVKVECSEGGVYRIGDKITVFDRYSPNKGKIFTIQDFRWSKDKSKICAVTELHTPNGIGLDKIELYVEPKVKQELSLLEQAKLKYPIGTKFKVACQPHVICTVLNHDTYYFQTEEICNLYVEGQNYGVNGATVYYKGKWAEIVDDFVLPEKWCVEVNEELRNRFDYYEAYGYHHSIQINSDSKWSDKIKKGFTEITFEQFKKYVLKDE